MTGGKRLSEEERRARMQDVADGRPCGRWKDCPLAKDDLYRAAALAWLARPENQVPALDQWLCLMPRASILRPPQRIGEGGEGNASGAQEVHP